jgi:hypothetical protein
MPFASHTVLVHRAVAFWGLALIFGGVPGCKDRSVGASHDGGVPDGAVLPDGAIGPDAVAACAEERLDMGFAWSTHVTASHPEGDLDVYEVAGTVIYLGPITVPIATNPAFDREVQIEHGDGQVSVVQYYVPAGVTLPLEEGFPYTFWLRRRQGFEGYAVGVVITRPTSGLVPLLFVADTGSYGRAFAPEDPAMQPLKVYVEPRPECPAVPDPECGGQQFADRLRFDSSTGGMITDVLVVQGGSGDLTVFGDPWRVTNLASTHVDQPCLDTPGAQVSYLGVNLTAVSLTCDPSRFYVWDTPDAISVGTWCDELFVCPTSAAQVTAIEAASPDVDCTTPVSSCPPGGPGCAWDASAEVDQDLYDQLCAVSVLADPPERIDCNVYFD